MLYLGMERSFGLGDIKGLAFCYDFISVGTMRETAFMDKMIWPMRI
jgi:hypothetical protein